MRKVEEMGVMHGNGRTCKRECQKGKSWHCSAIEDSLSLSTLSLSSLSLSLSQTAGGLLGCVRFVL
jgi:hypothetical protein